MCRDRSSLEFTVFNIDITYQYLSIQFLIDYLIHSHCLFLLENIVLKLEMILFPKTARFVH